MGRGWSRNPSDTHKQKLVLGGGVMQVEEILLPAVQDYVYRHAWTPWGKVQVLAAALGNDAGNVLGVGYLAEQVIDGDGRADHDNNVSAGDAVKGPLVPI